MKFSTIKVLNERDWIHQRPSIYLGSTEFIDEEFYFSSKGKFKSIKFIPALQKLFDEIVENSIDEFIRTKGVYANKIDVTVKESGEIIIEDNGRGLEIKKHHQFEDLYIPEVIYTKLRSGSNFDEREGIGVNGLGSVLTVLFSEVFEVTSYSDNKKYSQIYTDMMKTISEPKIKEIKTYSTGTIISFKPNFKFFKTNSWNLELLKKKITDLAFYFPKIKFTFNNEKIEAKRFKDYVEPYCNEYVIEENDDVKLALSINLDETSGCKHSSFVNGANTFQGGIHIDYIFNEITSYIRPKLEKKFKLTLKPNDVKNHLVIFCQMNLKNPIFSSQTKEKIINSLDEIKPLFQDILTERFYKKILANEVIINKIVIEAQMKQEMKDMALAKAKQKEIVKKKVHKLIDANGKDRSQCILFLTEGESAALTANTIRNTKIHAFLPLKGKVLNIFDLTNSEILHNEEIQDILNSTGLRLGDKPLNLRYGKIVCLMDEDEDGFSIKALLINFFFKYWPDLFKEGKIVFLKTPLFIAEKNLDKIYIYDKIEYEENKKSKLKGYHISYFKGLGGLNTEDWEYFLIKNPQYVTVNPDEYSGEKLRMVFSKDGVQDRKKWLMGVS